MSVQLWRRRTKERIIKCLGGKCVCCGYDRCPQALECHHLENKEDLIGKMMSNCAAWARIVGEIKKCVLVCANCHREIHEGIREVPSDAARYQEDPDYRPIRGRGSIYADSSAYVPVCLRR